MEFLTVYKMLIFRSNIMKNYFLKRFEINGLKPYSGSIQHTLWTNENKLIVIADIIDSGLNLITFDLCVAENTYELTETSRLKLDFSILTMSYNKCAKKLAIQSSNGHVYKYDENMILIDEFSFSQPCTAFKFITIIDTKGIKKEIYIGSTQYYRLYADNVEIANNCNSFYIHDEFLLFTDHSNTLKFVNLSKISKLFY